MARSRKRSLRSVLILTAFLAAGCLLLATARTSTAIVKLDDGAAYRITGPFTHENLSVYLIHAPQQDDRQFITLDQGLKAGVVKVSEKAQATVRELQIDNQSDDHLFLQEGDRLQGGQQDRTIFASLVIPPHSGPMALPAFCIESSRWSVTSRGKSFGDTANLALAPKAVRQACKISNDQGQVWEAVRLQKETAQVQLQVANTNTSLNETLDSPAVRILSDQFADALSGVLNDQQDVVGVAIVINGKVEEVNIYPNYGLLSKLYPRLLQSYALEATLQKDKAKDVAVLSPGEIARFMLASQEQSVQSSSGERVAATSQSGSLMFGVGVNSDAGMTGSLMFGVGVNSDAGLTGSVVLNRAETQNRQRPQRIVQDGMVIQFGVAARPGASRAQNINSDNRLEVHDQRETAACKTHFDGKVVHRQMMTKVRTVRQGGQTGAQVLQNEPINNLNNDAIGNNGQAPSNYQVIPQQGQRQGQSPPAPQWQRPQAP